MDGVSGTRDIGALMRTGVVASGSEAGAAGAVMMKALHMDYAISARPSDVMITTTTAVFFFWIHTVRSHTRQDWLCAACHDVIVCRR